MLFNLQCNYYFTLKVIYAIRYKELNIVHILNNIYPGIPYSVEVRSVLVYFFHSMLPSEVVFDLFCTKEIKWIQKNYVKLILLKIETSFGLPLCLGWLLREVKFQEPCQHFLKRRHNEVESEVKIKLEKEYKNIVKAAKGSLGVLLNY